ILAETDLALGFCACAFFEVEQSNESPREEQPMNMDDFSRAIDDFKDLTFRQLVDILSRIKIRVLLSIIGAFLIYTFFVFQFGQIFQKEGTAITLHFPFDMNIKQNAQEFKLKRLYLIEDDRSPMLDSEHITFQLRRISDGPIDTEEIGGIIAQKAKLKSLPFPWRGSIDVFGSVYAQENFQWSGHENNYRFYEKFINKNTIRRYYEDG